ncbi:MAG: hypothetical protein ABIT37_20340 [Luteolibacter sp.]
MSFPKSLGPQIGVIIGIACAGGLFWKFRPQNEAGKYSKPVTGKASSPAKQDHAEADKRKREGRSDSVKTSRSLTSDELVVIYESKGAAAALTAAKGMTGPERASQVVFILTYLARIDPEFVAGELKGAGLNAVHQSHVVDAVLNEWKDGEKALEWAKSGFTGDLLKKAAGGALRILVRTDPQAALAYLDTLSPGGSRLQAMADIFVPWGECDPKAALKLLAENFPADEKGSATDWVITGWSRNQPAEAAAWVGAVQDEALRARLVADVARNWKSKSPTEATAWVESLPEGAGKQAGKAVFKETVITEECGFGTSGPDVSWKTKAVATMDDKDFRNWGFQDPEGARKFLETAPEAKDLARLAGTVEIGIATKEGPAAAFDWAQTLQGEAGKEALRCAVISWAGSDPAAAAEKLKSLAPEQRPPLATALAENWSRSDPATAAAWVAAYDGTEQKSLVREVLQQWTDSQPREAYAWLGTLPMGPSRDEGINYLMRREASSDPKSVLPWIDLLSTPPLREKMRRELDGYLKADRKE